MIVKEDLSVRCLPSIQFSFSFQDTVVALEALTKYAITLPRSESGLSVVVTASEMEHTFHINEHERLLLKRQPLPVLPTEVEVDAVGEGCALVQVGCTHTHFFLDDDILFAYLFIIINGSVADKVLKFPLPLNSFLLHINCNFNIAFTLVETTLFLIPTHLYLYSQIPSPI